LVTRDQALADLPYLARWAAARPADDDALLNGVEELSKSTFALGDALAARKPVGELNSSAEAVRRSLNGLRDRHARKVSDLLDRETLIDWEEAEAALLVPFADAETRLRLVATCRAIERRLAARGNSAPVNAEALRRAAMERARRQGRMSLAAV